MEFIQQIRYIYALRVQETVAAQMVAESDPVCGYERVTALVYDSSICASYHRLGENYIKETVSLSRSSASPLAVNKTT